MENPMGHSIVSLGVGKQRVEYAFLRGVLSPHIDVQSV